MVFSGTALAKIQNNKEAMNILILYSGGLDSLIMARFAEVRYPNAKVTKVFYDIGQPYAAKEIAALPADVIQRKLPWLSPEFTPVGKEGSASGDIIIPGRNMLLATAAACMYLPDEIWMGALQGETHEGSTDKNYPFLNRLNETLAYVLRPFYEGPPWRSKAPAVARFPLADAGFNKLRAVRWALQNGITEAQIKASSSCLSGEPGNCGRCVVCLRRWGIFRQLGIPQEQYNVDPLTTPELSALAHAMVTGNHYDEDRTSEILPALPEDYFGKR